MSSVPAGHIATGGSLAARTARSLSPLVHLLRGASEVGIVVLALLPLMFGALALRVLMALPHGAAY